MFAPCSCCRACLFCIFMVCKQSRQNDPKQAESLLCLCAFWYSSLILRSLITAPVTMFGPKKTSKACEDQGPGLTRVGQIETYVIIKDDSESLCQNTEIDKHALMYWLNRNQVVHASQICFVITWISRQAHQKDFNIDFITTRSLFADSPAWQWIKDFGSYPICDLKDCKTLVRVYLLQSY